VAAAICGMRCFFWSRGGTMRAVSSIATSAMIAVLWTASVSAPAAADDQPVVKKATKTKKDKAKPDKNQYWLLYPTPPEQLRTFNTDRPTKANVPYTVDAGHFQYETDLVNFTRQVSGSTHTDTLMVPNPTFKIGLTNNVDLEVNTPFAGVHTIGSGPSSTLWGVGDTYVRSKINLWGNDGGDTAGALIPYVKAPSAPIGIGNGAVEGGLIGPVAVTLPQSVTLLLVPEIDALKNLADNGRHGNYVLDVNLSKEVIKNVVAYVELWSDYSADPTQGVTLMSADAAVQWLILPNTQIDVGANFGLTRATPALQVYTGLSQRF
jgi:Putative MetA-pathway of phenol degradation